MLAAALPAWGDIGLVTWLHPQVDGRFALESAVRGVEVRVATADGTPVVDAETLRAAGWEWSGDGFWQTPRRAGGGKLLITVSGLPAGTHQVYLRYFTQPRIPGNPWWFILLRGLDDGRPPSEPDRIVAGTGGHDPRTVYETHLGIVGTEEQPTAQLTLWIERYEWSELARFGSIRIETDPSMNYSTTAEPSPANERIRATLLENGPREDGKPVYGVAVVSGTLKVRPKSFTALEDQPLASAISMSAAKGEYESRQVLIYSPARDLVGVTVDCSPLTSETGDVIPATELLFAPVGYCPYRVPHNLTVHGWWPEPILTFLKQFTIQGGDVQTLWYRVHVPRDVRAGVYRGTVTVRAEGAPACTVPVDLRVWDFALPKWPRLRVVVGCNRVGEFEMSYGLNPSTIYVFDDRWTEEFPRWAEAGVTAINLAYIWGKQMDPQTKLPTDAQLDEWVTQIRRRYEAATRAGLRDACYVYLFDEATAEWDAAMQMVSGRLRQEFPDLLLLTTAHRAWYPGATVQDGGATIEDINGWCPATFHYNYEEAAKARRLGRQVWWYTCNSPEKPFANILMSHPATDARLLMGFMAFAYQTDGFLYYATAGGTYENRPAITEGPYTQWAIEDNAHNHLYQKGPDGPLPSLRLEAMRDGLEDYDYLYLAQRAQRDLREVDVTTPELEALAREITPYFAPGNGLVESLTEYSEDPQELESARERVARYVEEAQALLQQL